ncbi:MAG: type IV pilin protein [Rubrivivax sp.]|nr:type IV pilin protein [Rubrivivax sp.]
MPCITPRQRGFTLVEVLTTCTLLALLAAFSWPSLKERELQIGRIDAVQALTRVQQAQEQFRSAHGLYAADLSALAGTAPRSPQGRYAIHLALDGPEGYRVSALAQGTQAADATCATLTLQVRQGFAQTGPDARCWLR